MCISVYWISTVGDARHLVGLSSVYISILVLNPIKQGVVAVK